MTNSEGYDSLNFTLNKNAKKIHNSEALTEQLNQLNLHGISTPLNINTQKIKKLYYQRIYYIAVFQQKILNSYILFNKDDNTKWINPNLVQNNTNFKLIEIKKYKSVREERRVKNIAIRAIYALNLDFGLVKVGVTIGEKPWVMLVNTEQENKKISSLFDDAISMFNLEWQEFIKSNRNIVLGCDPEFVLQDSNGNLVLASKYLPAKGIVGCDRIWINRDRSQLPLAELRPSPSSEPRQLVINLYESLLICSQKIKNRQLKWLAGGMPIKNYSLGGHIHFSNTPINSFLLRALDNYLSLVITLFEDENGKDRRPKYGYLGDYRIKYHKGFEYRTLPSWLVSPTITKGVFALSKLIAENYYYLFQDPLNDIDVQKAYYKGDKRYLKPVVKNLWNELKELNNFSQYEKYLLPLEDYINNNYCWNEKNDIREVWFLPPYHKKFLKTTK